MRIERLVARLAQRHARCAMAATHAPLGSCIAQMQQPQQFAAGFATRAPSNSSSSSRKTKKQTPVQSFAIAEAFEGLDDDDSNDADNRSRNSTAETDGHSDHQSSSDVSREFLVAMEKKKSWMQTLAQQRQYDAIVKAVYDCYAPLYALPAAAALRDTSALLTTHFDAARVETKYQPQLFSTALTNSTEQEALALLVVARKGALARAVFDHRRALAAQLEATPVVVAASDSSASVLDDTRAPLDLSRHLRSFFSWGMGAYSLAHAHDAMLALYDDALAANVYPTASMNASYVRALVTLRRPASDVLAFYKNVLEHARPTNVFFYRQLVFFASVQHDTGLLLALLDDMKVKGFKLRAEDYEHAIRAFDDRYYLTLRQSRSTTRRDTAAALDQQLTTPLDTYASCVARVRELDDDPELFQDLDAAAHSVLALFDEMVDDERLVPTNESVFPRVIAAAVYAREYRKALAYVARFETLFPDATLHHAGVRMAVNAHLLLDEPAQAWAFVRKTYARFEQREFAHVANIVEYLCATHNAPELCRVLDDAKAMRILPLFSNSTVKILLPALIRSVESLSDDALWDTVCRFDAVFRVRAKPHAFAQFVNECVFRKRLGAAKRALKQRDPRRVGSLKPRIGLRAIAAFADAGDHAFVPEVLKAVDMAAATPDELSTLVFAVVRAHERLGRSRDESKRLFAKHIAPLVASGKIADVPADVAAIVQDA